MKAMMTVVAALLVAGFAHANDPHAAPAAANHGTEVKAADAKDTKAATAEVKAEGQDAKKKHKKK